MKITIKEITEESSASVMLDGFEYIIRPNKFVVEGEYAPVIIEEAVTHTKHESTGILDLNNHMFISKWNVVFDKETGSFKHGVSIDIEIV